MIKKLFFLILLGALGYILFMPSALEQTQSEFQEAGLDASVLELLDSN
jgi:hypothetical protein